MTRHGMDFPTVVNTETPANGTFAGEDLTAHTTFNSDCESVLEPAKSTPATDYKKPSAEERPCRTPRIQVRSRGIAPRVVKASDAAVYLCVSRWKLRRLVQDGLLPAIIGDGTAPWLFDVRDLDSYVDAAKTRL